MLAVEHTVAASLKRNGYSEYTREEVKKILSALQARHKEFEKFVLFDSFIDNIIKVIRTIKQPR